MAVCFQMLNCGNRDKGPQTHLGDQAQLGFPCRRCLCLGSSLKVSTAGPGGRAGPTCRCSVGPSPLPQASSWRAAAASSCGSGSREVLSRPAGGLPCSAPGAAVILSEGRLSLGFKMLRQSKFIPKLPRTPALWRGGYKHGRGSILVSEHMVTNASMAFCPNSLFVLCEAG